MLLHPKGHAFFVFTHVGRKVLGRLLVFKKQFVVQGEPAMPVDIFRAVEILHADIQSKGQAKSVEDRQEYV